MTTTILCERLGLTKRKLYGLLKNKTLNSALESHILLIGRSYDFSEEAFDILKKFLTTKVKIVSDYDKLRLEVCEINSKLLNLFSKVNELEFKLNRKKSFIKRIFGGK